MYPRLQPPKILLLERVISVALHVSAALHCDRKSPLAVNVIGHKAHLQATCCTRLRWNPWHLPLYISIWYILFYYPDVSCVCVGGGDFCHIAPAIILWDEAKNKDRKMLVGHWENETCKWEKKEKIHSWACSVSTMSHTNSPSLTNYILINFYFNNTNFPHLYLHSNLTILQHYTLTGNFITSAPL